MRVSGRNVPARAHLTWRARRTCSPGRQVPPGLCHAGTSERLPGSGGQNQREAVLPGGRKEAEKARSRVWLVGLLALALSGLAAASPTRTADSPNCTWCHRLMLVPSGASARFLGHLATPHIASHEGPFKVEQLCEHLAKRSAASPPMLREVKLWYRGRPKCWNRLRRKIRERFLCARLASAFAPASDQGKKNRAVNLLVTWTSMPASSVRSSFSAPTPSPSLPSSRPPPLPWLKLCSCPAAFFPRPLPRKQC